METPPGSTVDPERWIGHVQKDNGIPSFPPADLWRRATLVVTLVVVVTEEQRYGPRWLRDNDDDDDDDDEN